MKKTLLLVVLIFLSSISAARDRIHQSDYKDIGDEPFDLAETIWFLMILAGIIWLLNQIYEAIKNRK